LATFSLRQQLVETLALGGRALGSLVFPWTCLVCGFEGGSLEGPFCLSCRADLLALGRTASVSSCPRCALPVGPYAYLLGGCAECRGRSLGFDAALALGPYEHTLRDLCLRLKDERSAWLACWLSAILAEARKADLARLPPDTWVIPVPLHWWRGITRGYNQADALATALARELHLSLHHSLRRVRATDRLTHLSATDRLEAMRDVFRSRREPGLKSRTILLVDDILTTGATAGAAARVLKHAGARRIVVAVMARTLRGSS
jgi:ComF family protein